MLLTIDDFFDTKVDPKLKKAFRKGERVSEIIVAQAILDRIGPDGSLVDDDGDVWNVREGKYVSCRGWVWRINFDRRFNQIPCNEDSLSYIAEWPD